jgi:hypothetical protein
MALAWIEALNREGVPWQRYDEIYHRTIKLRARRFAAGLQCDDFSVEMMIACWNELEEDIRQREIASRQYIPAVAESGCDKCFGTGVEIIDGKGARPCKHI